MAAASLAEVRAWTLAAADALGLLHDVDAMEITLERDHRLHPALFVGLLIRDDRNTRLLRDMRHRLTKEIQRRLATVPDKRYPVVYLLNEREWERRGEVLASLNTAPSGSEAWGSTARPPPS